MRLRWHTGARSWIEHRPAQGRRGARTRACRVDTRVDAWEFRTPQNVEKSLDAARKSACATVSVTVASTIASAAAPFPAGPVGDIAVQADNAQPGPPAYTQQLSPVVFALAPGRRVRERACLARA